MKKGYFIILIMVKIMKDDKVIKIGLLFYICSIFGYFYELLLNYINTHKIFSHGFFKGPWLPVYGTGAVFLTFINKYKNNPLLIFLLSFLITGGVEYSIGFILLHLFKMRLWDYTGMFLNIDGLVCFLSAFCFGIGGLLVTYVIYPLINKFVNKINKQKIISLLSLLSLCFMGDVIATMLK